MNRGQTEKHGLPTISGSVALTGEDGEDQAAGFLIYLFIATDSRKDRIGMPERLAKV